MSRPPNCSFAVAADDDRSVQRLHMADPHARSPPRPTAARVRASTSWTPPSSRCPPSRLQLPPRAESSICTSRTSQPWRLAPGTDPPRACPRWSGHAASFLAARTCRWIRTRRTPYGPRRTDTTIAFNITRIILWTRRDASSLAWSRHWRRTATHWRLSAGWISYWRTHSSNCARRRPAQFALALCVRCSNGTCSHTSVIIACPAQFETHIKHGQNVTCQGGRGPSRSTRHSGASSSSNLLRCQISRLSPRWRDRFRSSPGIVLVGVEAQSSTGCYRYGGSVSPRPAYGTTGYLARSSCVCLQCKSTIYSSACADKSFLYRCSGRS